MSTPEPSRDDTREVADAGYDAIARRAYDLWVEGGRQDGHALADWYRAEEEYRRQLNPAANDEAPAPALMARETVPDAAPGSGGQAPGRKSPAQTQRQRQKTMM